MIKWLLFCVMWSGYTSIYIKQLLTENETGSLSHVVVTNQSLIIGATNVIYQMDLDLNLKIKIITGPQNDSQKCGINLDSCAVLNELSPMDNHNRILLLHSNQIVICGSIFQGKCEIRNVKNISEVIFIGNYPVVSNEIDAKTIAFITRVMNSATRGTEPMIYVATEYTRFDKSRNSLEFNLRRYHPLVSTRLFDFQLRGKIVYETENKYEKPGLISYVHGFASGNYSYIVLNERNPDDTSHYSKIVHMCRRDDLLKTFLEIPLTCKSNIKTFNFLKDAKIFKPGMILLKSLQEVFSDLTSEDDVIIGLFSQSVDNSSAICLFIMPEVTRKVLTNIKTCLNGSTEYAANLKYKNGLQCTKLDVSSFTDDELLCSSSLNLIIDGKTPVVSAPVIQFPATEDNPESLAVTITGEHTVVFLGTSYGHIKKVAKIPVQNCSQYTKCRDCLSSNDPYCGWCVLVLRCSLKSDCYNPTNIRWVNRPEQEKRCIEILNVSPPMLHVSQNITLNLTIKDLPRDDNTSYNCVFSFPTGDQVLSPAAQWSLGTHCRNPNLSINFNSSLGKIIKVLVNILNHIVHQ
ncbi:plexin-B-like isoform X2 [Saccostrea cucullata]|uniref:plexin-B-like isoform X2 n=1 Tax=Saccostrea cuccullata TaxID=36930 RepID=UPI002ED0F222